MADSDQGFSPNAASLLDLLPSRLKTKQTWIDMMEVFQRVMDINVEGPQKQLESIRDFQESDDGILNSTARLLGFDLTQDVLNLSSDNLTKLVSQLSLYPDNNGTEKFVKFIDLLLNALTEVEYLWTRDYVNFYRAPKGPTIKEGGPWFKATHINLTMALFTRDTLVLAPGQTLYGRTKELFYTFAPAALVIERLDFAEYFEDKDWLGGSAFGIGCTLLPGEIEITID